MPLLGFTVLIIFSVATSQSHDVNSQTSIRNMTGQGSVEAASPIPSDPTIDNKRIEPLVSRLENLFMEKLGNLTTEVGRMSQSCSSQVTLVVPINESLEVKVENLSKDIQILMDATKILSSNVEMIKQDVSSFINNTRIVMDSLSNFITNPIFYERLQEQKKLQTVTSTSSPLNCTLDNKNPKNCGEVQESGKRASGIYMIQPEGAAKPFEAVCELGTWGGNWTVIQLRFDGSQDFNLGWQDYKNGFGNVTGEFWIGLQNIYLLTGHEHNDLLLELGYYDKSLTLVVLYHDFSVGSEMEGYFLKSLDIDPETIADSLSHSIGNLNGKYLKGGDKFKGMRWDYMGLSYSFKRTRMLVRPMVRPKASNNHILHRPEWWLEHSYVRGL